VTSGDKSIRELKGYKQGDGSIPEAVLAKQFEQSVTVSQIAVMANRKAIIACVEEKDHPGSIQVIKGDLSEKVFEIQAHSLGVERLRLSYDN
jgi:hypothetical protein